MHVAAFCVSKKLCVLDLYAERGSDCTVLCTSNSFLVLDAAQLTRLIAEHGLNVVTMPNLQFAVKHRWQDGIWYAQFSFVF